MSAALSPAAALSRLQGLHWGLSACRPWPKTVIPASDSDVELFALLDRCREAQAAWRLINDGAFAGVYAARDATRPPIPAALFWRHSDVFHEVGPAGGRESSTDARRREFFDGSDVERLRQAPSLTKWDSPDSETMPVRAPDPVGEARRWEIVSAHDRWMTECRAAEDACGFTRACEIEENTAAALDDAEEAVKLCLPRTLAGLARKAAWVADLLSRDAGCDDLGELFAHQVAAFGGVAT